MRPPFGLPGSRQRRRPAHSSSRSPSVSAHDADVAWPRTERGLQGFHHLLRVAPAGMDGSAEDCDDRQVPLRLRNLRSYGGAQAAPSACAPHRF